MDRLHRSILARMRESILQDLDVTNGIIDQLTTDYILKDEDLTKISRGITRLEKAEILLDILPNRGPYAFETFQQALRHHYSWLSDDMGKLLISSDTQASDTGITRTPTLPPISPLTVPREHKIEQLKTALRELNPGGYVVLHGMKGFGKSCLTASTLKDTVLVKNLFNHQIYWIKFGYKNPIEDEILIQLNLLYHLIKNDPPPPDNDNNCGLLKDDIRKRLKHYFSSENHRNALLILDDVWDESIIETFDFSCKTLVITTNIDLLGDRHKEVVEMKNGFTEAESLGLFAKVLDIDVNKLPQEAKDIHYECNGMPILIAMFAAQFQEYKEEMRHTRDRWQYYLRSLRKKDPTNKVIEKFLTKQEAIFDMCIDRLPADSQSRYRNLVIFSEDVNITSKTLEILWDEQSLRVDEQMSDLCHKSLAAREWNVNLKTYIYGVHDLLLCHLRKNLEKHQLSEMHKNFIEKYRKHCDGDFSKLPNDNYSFSYIGHHLEQAEMFGQFQNLYLDFNFIRAKICNSGISDLLIDLKKYRKYITNNDEAIEAKVDDLESFLSAQVKILAEHRRRGCLDLVQIGINHSVQGYLHETARTLAEGQPMYLYMSHYKQHPIDEPRSDEVPIELSTVNFTDNPNQILIGSNYGDVILWDTETRRQSAFCGHERSKIVKVIVSHHGDFFLALNDKGVVKRFVLEHHDDEDNLENGAHIQTPREKQFSWSGIYRSPMDTSITTYDLTDQLITDITDIALSSRDNKLAACTGKGVFRVWDISGQILCTESTKVNTFQRLSFAKDDSLLFFVNAEEGVVPVYGKIYNEKYQYRSIYRPMRETKNEMKVLNGRSAIYFAEVANELPNVVRMLLVTDLEAVVINWDITENGHVSNPSTRYHVTIDMELNPSTRFTAATLTYDYQYIVIADSEGLIKVWGVYDNISVKASYPGKAVCLDTYWYSDKEWHLMMGGLNQLTHRWLFKWEGKPKFDQSVRRPRFDAIMRPIGELDTVAQVMDKKVGIFQGHTLMAETEMFEGDIVDLYLCQDGKQILYVGKKGHRENLWYELRVFNYENKVDRLVKKLHDYKRPAWFLNINDTDVIVWKEGENLKIAMAPKIHTDAKFTGNVINLHTIRNNYVLTVGSTGKIMIWEISGTEWFNVFQYPGRLSDNVCYSTLNSQKNMLTLLKTHGEMIIYLIEEKRINSVTKIEMDEYVKLNYFKKLTCASFSQDGKFLAIGMDDGAITIFDVHSCTPYGDLSLHCHSVLQLDWAPSAVGVPILLSVNCEDIAWWNISLLHDQKKLNRRSRTGLPRSATTPTIGMSPRGSMRMTGSQSANIDFLRLSAELEFIDNGDSNGDDDGAEVKKFWSSKVAKYKDKPALLGLVQLPASCRPKVCVSSDFKKFLLVDVHGSINTYKLFGLSDVQF